MPDDCAQHEPPGLHCSSAVSATFDTRGRLWVAYVVGEHLWVSMRPSLAEMFTPARRVNLQAEKIAARGENRPQIIVADEYVMLSWSRPGSRRFTADIRFSVSSDGGLHFSTPRTLNRDSLGPEPDIGHSFNQMQYRGGGRLQVFWLDGRERAAALERGEPFKGSSLFYTESQDFGAHFGEEYSLSQQTCECCRLAVTADRQHTWLMWREIDASSGARDHALGALQGNAWAHRLRASHENWVVDACPHHGPDLALQEIGHIDRDQAQAGQRIHAVWFSPAKPDATLWYRHFDASAVTSMAQPADTGSAPSLQVSTHDEAQSFGNAQQQAAHPQVQSLGQYVVRSWQEFDGEQTHILTQSSQDSGRSWQAPVRRLSTAGSADYAFLLSDGESLYLSWLTQNEGYRIMPLDTRPTSQQQRPVLP